MRYTGRVIPQDGSVIRYTITGREGVPCTFTVDELGGAAPLPATVPAWAQLALHRCYFCDLPSDLAACPAAHALLPLVEAFPRRASFEQVQVQVALRGYEMSVATSLQDAARSLAGLLLPLSGCPVLTLLRPMAQFHEPFSDPDQTVVRAMGMYLLAQHVRGQVGLVPDWPLEGLRQLYHRLHTVNQQLAARLRMATPADANVNGVVLLDLLAHAVDAGLDRDLPRLMEIFRPYLQVG